MRKIYDITWLKQTCNLYTTTTMQIVDVNKLVDFFLNHPLASIPVASGAVFNL